MEHKESINAAIMFTDVKDFTLKTSLLTQKQIDSLLDDHDNILTPILLKYSGKIIKTIGDSYMVVFDSSDNAINAGIEIHNSLTQYNKSKLISLYKIEIKISIDYGKINRKETIKGEDYFGESVNIASRMLDVTSENRIFISHEAFKSLTKNHHYRILGSAHFKGVVQTIEILDVLFKKSDIKLYQDGKLDTIDIFTHKGKSYLVDIKDIESMIFNYSSVGAILGIQPVPFFDIYSILPLHLFLLKEIAKKYGVNLTHRQSKEVLSTLIGSLGVTYSFSHGIMGLTKLGLVGFGGYILVPFNFALTFAIGKVLNLYFYYDSQGKKLNKKELRDMFEFSKQEGLKIAKSDKKKVFEIGRKYKDKIVTLVKAYKDKTK